MKQDDTNPDLKVEEEKKNYQSPQLTVYGNIRDITKAIGLTGADDGTTKTSLP